ncbi:CS012 protein, partial [Horornis vulcanius]|nr:CS012 protein [Horornis vulcanius]
LPAAEKQKLCAEATAVVRNINWTDAAHLIAIVMGNAALKDMVLGVLTTYLTNELKAQIQYAE